MAKSKANPEVEAGNQEASLISSNSLPEFEDIEREYQATIEAITASTPEPVGTVKKTRGRKKSDGIPSDANEVISEGMTPDQLESIVCFPLDSWFVRNDKKRLSNIERKAFAESCSRLANKWLPKIASQWQEEIGFCICISTIFMCRMDVKPVMEEKSDETVKSDVQTKTVEV